MNQEPPFLSCQEYLGTVIIFTPRYIYHGVEKGLVRNGKFRIMSSMWRNCSRGKMNYYTRDAKIFDERGNCVGIFKTEYEATQIRDNLQKRLDEVLDQCGTFTYHATYRNIKRQNPFYHGNFILRSQAAKLGLHEDRQRCNDELFAIERRAMIAKNNRVLVNTLKADLIVEYIGGGAPANQA